MSGSSDNSFLRWLILLSLLPIRQAPLTINFFGCLIPGVLNRLAVLPMHYFRPTHFPPFPSPSVASAFVYEHLLSTLPPGLRKCKQICVYIYNFTVFECNQQLMTPTKTYSKTKQYRISGNYTLRQLAYQMYGFTSNYIYRNSIKWSLMTRIIMKLVQCDLTVFRAQHGFVDISLEGMRKSQTVEWNFNSEMLAR